MKHIAGKIIKSIYMNEDNDYILFLDDSNIFYAYTVCARCCASAWIESVNNPQYMIGSPVLEVIEKEKDYEHPGCDELWGYTIKTLKGYCDIEFRCDTNEYYTGVISLDTTEYESVYADEESGTVTLTGKYSSVPCVVKDIIKHKKIG